jgi:predicted enzyme related to lactoylglutathione lyase
MPSAVNWFQIPASDMARAKTFYETICRTNPSWRRAFLRE